MSKYGFAFFLTFFAVLCCFGQYEQMSFLDQLIENNKTQSSENVLSERFRNLLKNTESQNERDNIEVLHATLLARLHFDTLDGRNSKSDSLYKFAVSKALKSNVNLVIWVNTQYGFYLYSNSLYKDALPYFLNASRLIDKYGNDLQLQPTDVLKKNSFFFGSIKDYARAAIYTQKALEITDKNSFDYGTLLNALGKNYEATGNKKLAEKYFNETLEVSKSNHDKVRYAKALGDLALLYAADKKWKKAEDYLLEDIAISKEYKSERNIMFAQVQLGDLYYKVKRYKDAITVLGEAEDYAKSKLYLKKYEQQIIALKLAIAIAQNDIGLELLYRRKLDTIGLQVSKTASADIINSINLEAQNENIKLQLSAEKENAENELLIKKMSIIIGVILFLLLISLFVMNKRKLKYQQLDFDQKLQSFQIEKVRSESKLKQTNYSLESYKTYLIEKNQQISELEREIEQKNSSTADVQQKEAYTQLLNSHLLTEDNWQQFKKEFIREQSDFYQSTLQKYSNLTESHLRLVMLAKLGLSNPNIANLLGVTLDGVKKAKQRLKKKHDDILKEL